MSGEAPRGGGAEAGPILLLGPTACGKSGFALRLARKIALEIVSVDSAQVYRGMDIGTAKPSAAQRAEVPHHLIDLRDPAQPYSVADFLRDALDSVRAIRGRGRLPLLAGGTMMYARALRQGLADLPPADARIRARLALEARERGWPALHARLAQLDPATAVRLAPGDSQRIQRALEVVETTGRPMSAQLGAAPAAIPPPTIGLMPSDRAELHRRIELRFDRMLAAGLLDEVRQLRARGDLGPDLPSMRSVGYRQAWEHLEHGTPFAAFRAAAIAATRQLAKRQITWLRSMTDALLIDPFAEDAFERIEAVVSEVSRRSIA
jgi:tRNA dimethylallyltransferase